MKALNGTGVALITPFNEENEVDFSSLKKVLDHTAPYVDYWVVNGTTGESATLTGEEKQAILDFVAEYNKGLKPIVFGIGGNNTQEVISQLEAFDLQEVDAILSVAPYYNKPTQQGMLRHYELIADHATKPIILYNVPSRTAVNMTADTICQLSFHPNIIAVKEASGDLTQSLWIKKNAAKGFLLISGEDPLTVPLISIGAVGVISVAANVVPESFCKMVNHALNNDFERATSILMESIPLIESLFEEGNPTGAKQALELMGVCSSSVRLPLFRASDQLKEKIQSLL
ncbi:4-hydroxy-tetrahydrodipicolinate synthase [Limibacter armeniacum]|uniref:4-hydroxy-tetrahydrodipicolinate synthase n=1 Tax=Limibacter armeniacum TaxID=466084 RepID=UPI002FE5D207